MVRHKIASDPASSISAESGGAQMMFSLLGLTAANLIYLILHVTNSGSFPRPLTATEERHYLDLFKAGDLTAKNVLIEHNLRLVAHIIKKYYSNARDQDDLISIGTIGLIKAVSTFDSDKGTRLATYAARCIENEILMYFRNQKKTAQDVYISDPIDTDKDGNQLTLNDVICCDDTILDDVDLKMKSERLHHYIKTTLDGRERLIIEMRYGIDGVTPKTQREVAKILKISRSYVSRIEKKALLELRELFERDDSRVRSGNTSSGNPRLKK
jgi:RNA polymerase sporulation-specific sigma factor